MVALAYDFLGPPRPKNFSKNRPDDTNRNHQYAKRRDCMTYPLKSDWADLDRDIISAQESLVRSCRGIPCGHISSSKPAQCLISLCQIEVVSPPSQSRVTPPVQSCWSGLSEHPFGVHRTPGLTPRCWSSNTRLLFSLFARYVIRRLNFVVSFNRFQSSQPPDRQALLVSLPLIDHSENVLGENFSRL
jgi:hypothetical protein